MSNLLENLNSLIASLSIVSIVLILSGITLVVLESHRNFKKVLFISGALLIISGITIIQLHTFSLFSLFALLVIVFVILITNHLLILFFTKRLWLYQSIRQAIGIELDTSEILEQLVGIEAQAISNLDNMGTVAIGEQTFFAKTDGFIPMGQKVIIKGVEKDIVVVERSMEDKK